MEAIMMHIYLAHIPKNNLIPSPIMTGDHIASPMLCRVDVQVKNIAICFSHQDMESSF